MITISDILLPKHILFNLDEDTQERAVTRVAELLRNDPRVTDWAQFYTGLVKGTSCMTKENGSVLCIAHARTTAVSAMTMAVGRVLAPPASAAAPANPAEPGSQPVVAAPPAAASFRLIFVIGVPVALASDYLRIIGALARIFHTEKGEAALVAAATPAEFLESLGQLEIAL